MPDGEILCVAGGLPLYGKNGTLLYRTPVSMSCTIVIGWSGGDDLDICAFYTHNSSQQMGFSHGSSIDLGDGFTGAWTSGDNTQGGPESVSIAYSGSQGLAGKSFEVRTNWYRTGEGKAGGAATVTATDAKGNSFSYTLSASTSEGRGANTGDPGVRIYFNFDGTIKEISGA